LITLILDEDGIYDPAHFNDRLLLGLKGTMSEAELHVLRARLQGGILNKARRGELIMRPPVGLNYDSERRLILDRDQEVQAALRLLFDTFRRTGSATATVKAFQRQGLRFPRRVHTGPHRGDLVSAILGHSQVLRILHNPRYAGAFVYGMSHTRRTIDGGIKIVRVPDDQWEILIPGAHPGYISWDDYERNLRCLRQSAQAMGWERRKSPAREGPALLQGLILCGRCGERMTVRYHSRHGRLWPEYVCQREGVEFAGPPCQRIPGAAIDDAISELLVQAVSPLTLDIALTVQQELQRRLDDADRLRHKQVERAQYEADLARRRYMRVDPDNRLVADSLEAEWNGKLRILTEVQQEYQPQREQDRQVLSEDQRAAILALANDFPALWRDPKTPDRERKRMIRLLLEDITLIRREHINVHIRFKGGATRTLTLPLPCKSWPQWKTSPDVVEEINSLLDQHTYRQIAASLNERTMRSGQGKVFTSRIVAGIQRRHRLMPRYDRLRNAGMLTVDEIAAALGICPQRVTIWARHGLIRAHPYNDKNDCL
jgi:hypothetical protein